MDNNSGNVQDLLGDDTSNSGRSTTTNNQNDNGANTENSTPSEKLYELPDGRKVTAEKAIEEYNNLHGDYTRKSQELAKLKQTPAQTTTNPSGEPTFSKEDQSLVTELERLGFTRKAAVEEIIKGEAPKIIDASTKRSVSTTELNEALTDLEIDFDGSEGKPKINKQDILKWIVANPTTNLSPLDIAHQVYYKDFVSYDAKQLASGATPSNLPATENQGANVTTPPNKPVYSFRDGSALRAAQAMLKKA